MEPQLRAHVDVGARGTMIVASFDEAISCEMSHVSR